MQNLISRKDFLKLSALASISGFLKISYAESPNEKANYPKKSLSFDSIYPNKKDEMTIPKEFAWNLLIKWGDPLDSGEPLNWKKIYENITQEDVERQKYCFGYNNDYIGFFQFSDKFIMVVNHEYTNPEIMFKNFLNKTKTDIRNGRPSKLETDFMLNAHGVSIIEIKEQAGGFYHYVKGSNYNKRFTGETKIEISGPARGHKLLKTFLDPIGSMVEGTLNNCSGGKTPWGTFLTCEENFHTYFGGNIDEVNDPLLKEMYQRYGIPDKFSKYFGFDTYYDRFNILKEPNESFRFGWVVEIDPLNPNKLAKKRTALGRFKHEAANTAIGLDDRVAVYMGDDERFEYLYKFITKDKYNSQYREKNMDLLDEGILYVASFNEDFTGEWIEIVSTYKVGNQYRFRVNSKLPELFQNDPVLCFVYTRKAADLLGATKMDRPEDVEFNPITKTVFAAMTYNEKRKSSNVDAVNPRPENTMGHIIEIIEENHNSSSTKFQWQIPLLCGDPTAKSNNRKLLLYGEIAKSKVPPISAPDNLAFDKIGNIWIATDGNSSEDRLKSNDGIYVLNPYTKELKMFLSGVPNCEICGPEFSEDYTTFFCAIQHPGEGDLNSTKWPYLNDKSPIPRPAVLQIRRKDGAPFYV